MRPGFVSSALQRSFDCAKVTIYAQWRTVEDYEAMRRTPRAFFLHEALTIAKFVPGVHEVGLRLGLVPVLLTGSAVLAGWA